MALHGCCTLHGKSLTPVVSTRCSGQSARSNEHASVLAATCGYSSTAQIRESVCRICCAYVTQPLPSVWWLVGWVRLQGLQGDYPSNLAPLHLSKKLSIDITVCICRLASGVLVLPGCLQETPAVLTGQHQDCTCPQRQAVRGSSCRVMAVTVAVVGVMQSWRCWVWD
jgi:hypothetical protein